MTKKIIVGLIALWLASFFIRWYYLPSHLFFGFEQGRDALIVDNIWHGRDFVLVGPKTDIGGVFHGAWYYYLMAVPYAISQGNPLGAAAFLVGLSSLVPVGAVLLGYQVTRRWEWGWVAGFVALSSYELIHYSRWLSNVTPAIPLIVSVMGCLWLYRQTHRERWWIAAAGLAALAAQFQIILSLWFLWFVVWLFVTKWMKVPGWRAWLSAVGIAAVLFAPMVLFNIRNDWISILSLRAYVAGSPDQAETTVSIPSAVVAYGKQLWRLWRVTLPVTSDVMAGVLLGAAAGGLVLAGRKSAWRPGLWLGLSWLTMSWLVIFFPKSLSLPQLYIGGSVALAFLMALSLAGWWSLKVGKVIVAVFVFAMLAGLVNTEILLRTNQAVFFRTIQDDLNYRDQQALLRYIHEDAGSQTYAWQAFAIPYFQEEGWQYLHRFFYPNDRVNREHGSPYYLIIEKPVDPYWVKKWTDDLGSTELLDTKHFGLLTVEKRQRTEQETIGKN